MMLSDDHVAHPHAGCPEQPAEQGSVRLRGGFGTPCDPVHTGFVEIFNAGEWGAICDVNDRRLKRADILADVICRQLGFPHGTVIPDEEAGEPQDRFWLVGRQALCLGPEERVVDCDLGSGFRNNNSGCMNNPPRLAVACRSFAVPEALEAVATPGAGTLFPETLRETLHLASSVGYSVATSVKCAAPPALPCGVVSTFICSLSQPRRITTPLNTLCIRLLQLTVAAVGMQRRVT